MLLGAPVRVYDSRQHGVLAAGHARTISLAAHLPVEANGAQCAVAAFESHGSGALNAGAANTALNVPAVRWARTGDRSVNTVTTAVDGLRSVGVRSLAGSGKTHFTVDLVAYLV